MRIIHLLSIVCLMLFFYPRTIIGYNEPGVNLGYTNFLDGGPIRPEQGWYFFGYTQYYHANKLLDGDGNLLGGVPSPEFTESVLSLEAAYQGARNVIPHSELGIDVTLPIVLTSTVGENLLDIADLGSGFGDLYVRIYLQWDPIVTKNDRPLFVHRLSFGVGFPTGRDKFGVFFTPGNRLYTLQPYWAATLFITEEWAASWRLYYIWNTQDSLSKIQPGDAVLLNYSFTYRPREKILFGINGYFLQELRNDKLCGKEIPNSRERVLGLGPGFLLFLPRECDFFAHLYIECDVRNRPKGISFIFSLVKHF